MKHLNQITRRGALLCVLASITGVATAKDSQPTVEVWKDPNCGCCKEWVTHLEESGFQVTVNDTGNEAARRKLGIPAQLGSCHTGLIGGYALEGHVPAREIKRLLKEKPKAVGLAVPGMVVGSPGMDGEVYKGKKAPFDVLLVARDGNTTVFQPYR